MNISTFINTALEDFRKKDCRRGVWILERLAKEFGDDTNPLVKDHPLNLRINELGAEWDVAEAKRIEEWKVRGIHSKLWPTREHVTARLEFDGASIYCYPFNGDDSFKTDVGHVMAATRLAIITGRPVTVISTLPTETESARHYAVPTIACEVILWENNSPVVL